MRCFNRPPTPEVLGARAFHLERPGEPPRRYDVEALRSQGTDLLVKFEGLDDRTASASIVGALASIPEAELPPPGPLEFYYHEIIGYAVRTTDGRDIGHVRETFGTGSNDVLVVGDADHEQLIPVIGDVVRTIDRERRLIVIEALDGLLDS
jgi:16S rRNA processing protein RimM